MRTGTSPLVVLPLAVVAALAAISAPACYGATEVSVVVTTTAPCTSTFTTQIFTGASGTTDFGTAPAAETTTCGAVEPRIGTIAVVPSAARDDQFDLEVIGAVGVPASDCRPLSLATSAGAGPVAPGGGGGAATGCIVARRRVSFRPHKSITVPVLLSKQCIGIPCGFDQTCDLGACTPTVECTDLGCPRERAASPTPEPVTDAAADAPVVLDAGGGGRCAPAPEVVIDGQQIVGPLVMQGADFVYVNTVKNVAGTVSEVRRVPRAGAAVAQLVAPSLDTSASSTYAAVAAGPGFVIWAEQSRTMAYTTLLLTQTDGHASNASSFFDRATLAVAGHAAVGVWHALGQTQTQVFSFEVFPAGAIVNTGTPSLPGDVPELVVDEDAHFFGVSAPDVVFHETLAANDVPVESGRITSLSGVVPDVAVANRTLYVAARTGGGAQGIFRIARDLVKEPYADAPWLELASPTSSLPQSLASDGTNLYVLLATALLRLPLSASPPSGTLIASTAPLADRLQVDDQCVYWVEGGTRIMKKAK